MNCPNCGKEMELGRVYSKGVLFWSPKLDRIWRIPDKESAALSSPGEYPAGHICKDCRKVILEY